MWKKLAYIQKNLVWAIPISMILGILFGYLSDPKSLKITIMPLTFLMVYPMMINLNVKKIFSKGDLNAQLVTQIVNFGVIPFIAFGIGLAFFKEMPYYALGLLLMGLIPTSGMTISWTGLLREIYPQLLR